MKALFSQFHIRKQIFNPVYKKNSNNEKENYRPVNILPNLYKIYECCLLTQMNRYFNPILSKYQFGFRRGYSARQCFLTMIEKWRASLDQNGTCAALLTDLSKAFDCLPNDLLLAKLHAYGCDLQLLKLLNSYLGNSHQRVKINHFYSSWAEILCGAPYFLVFFFAIYISLSKIEM